MDLDDLEIAWLDEMLDFGDDNLEERVSKMTKQEKLIKLKLALEKCGLTWKDIDRLLKEKKI